jgi:hypothetical protein
MSSAVQISPASKNMLWTGRIITGILVLYMLFNCSISLVKPAFVRAGLAHLGYPDSLAVGVGIVMFTCTVLYAIPRTRSLEELAREASARQLSNWCLSDSCCEVFSQAEFHCFFRTAATGPAAARKSDLAAAGGSLVTVYGLPSRK